MLRPAIQLRLQQHRQRRAAADAAARTSRSADRTAEDAAAKPAAGERRDKAAAPPIIASRQTSRRPRSDWPVASTIARMQLGAVSPISCVTRRQERHHESVFQNVALAYLGIGLVVGLIIGLNIEGLWPSVPLHATATHGLDKFAIATGLVDDSVEALYFLDFLTGDMRAAVINPKTGKFNSFFTRNIATDFGGAGRSSGYLLVTGFGRHAARPRELPVRQEHRVRRRSQHRPGRRLHDSLELDAAGGRQAAVRRVSAARRAASSAPPSSATSQ